MSGEDYSTRLNNNSGKPTTTSILRDVPQESRLERINNILMEKYDLPDFLHPPSPKQALFTILGEVRRNWTSGVTVSLVSIPLSVSLAIASDAPPVMGIVTAVWGGLFAAMLGGSEYNIMGPTGALSGLLSLYSISYGINVLPLIAILVGLICLIVFVLRLQKFFMFIPSAVVHGFTIGVAFIIALNQLTFALGLQNIPRHESFTANLWEALKHIGDTHIWSFLLFVLDTAGLLLLARWKPAFPWVIIFSIFGICLGVWVEVGGFPIRFLTLNTLYSDLTLRLFMFPKFSASMFNATIFNASLSVAFVTILETLISAKIADRMTNTAFSQPREIFGIGASNLICGCFGGFPGTAALARTALNIKSGASSRMSGIINAISIAFISLLLLRFFKYLLLSMIASILTFTAVRMVETEAITHMFHYDKFMLGFTIVIALIVVLDEPISGIVFGGIIALLMYANHNSEGRGDVIIKKTARTEDGTTEDSQPIEKQHTMEDLGDTLLFKLLGDLTYLNAVSQVDKAKKMIEKTEHLIVIISLRYLFHMDIDGLDAITEIVHEFETKNNRLVLIAGLQPDVESLVKKAKWFKLKRENGYVFATTREALAWVERREIAAAQKRNKIHQMYSESNVFPARGNEPLPPHLTRQGYYDLTENDDPIAPSSQNLDV